jgi:hypothetical protein
LFWWVVCSVLLRFIIGGGCEVLLGAFAKLRKAIISFVMSVCPSVCRREQLGFHWTDFDDIQYLPFLENLSTKIKVSFQSDKNNVYFT